VRAVRGVSAVLAAAAVGAALGGCAGHDAGASSAKARVAAPPPTATDPATGSTRPVQREAPPAGPPADDFGLPPHVPARATGAARSGDLRIIRRWLAALRAGHIRRAAESFRLPSRFQNGTPVLWLSVPAERISANETLTCGARLLDAGASGAYVIVRLRLVTRPGARCGRLRGRTARAAIRVAFASIVEYYRLPTDPRVAPVRLVPHPGPASSGPGPSV
jgi:hypothetical protein